MFSKDKLMYSYQYSCGGWLKSTTLPPDKTSITRSFSNISDENTLLIREILQDGWPVISEFYDNCMNNDVRGSRGSTPLAELIGLINTVETPLIRTIAELHKRGVPALFSFDLGTDLDDPSMGLANLDQGGYGLPRDYYFNPSPTFVRCLFSFKKQTLFFCNKLKTTLARHQGSVQETHEQHVRSAG